MNKDDIKDFLTKQDTIRDKINKNVDKVFSQVNIDSLLSNPEKGLNEIVKKIVKSNSKAFKESTLNGEELVKKL